MQTQRRAVVGRKGVAPEVDTALASLANVYKVLPADGGPAQTRARVHYVAGGPL